MSEPALTPDLVRRMEIKPTLANMEHRINRALCAYMDAGDALRTIRDRRLYKPAFKSFDAYCKERWGWARAYADRQIAAADVYESIQELPTEVTPIGVTLEPPRSEGTARELVPFRRKPKVLAKVWTETVERHGPDATAAQVRKVVREVVPTQASQEVLPPERTLDDAVNALRRLMGSGYETKVLRAALDAIDPTGRS